MRRIRGRRSLLLVAAVIAAGGLVAGYAVAGVGSAAAAGTTAAITPTLGASHTLPPGFFGMNFDNGAALIYAHDAQFPQQLTALHPGTLRWPGGTGANYFQWRLGRTVPAPTTNPGPCPPPSESEPTSDQFTLSQLKAAVSATGATPIFDLNVMTSTVSDQIAMLKQAQSDGLSITHIELGNELYLCNNDYVHYFANGSAYGATVGTYVHQLHVAFPNVNMTIAAVGAIGTNTTRDRDWNQGMLNAAKAGGLPTAITLHDYPNAKDALTHDNLDKLFAEPVGALERLNKASSGITQPVWVTEENLKPRLPQGVTNPAQHTFTQALFADQYALLFSQRAKNTSLIDYWASFGWSLSYAYNGSGPAPTPAGQALELLGQAAAQANGHATIGFPNGPVINGKQAALVGESFTTSSGARQDLVINLSDTAVTLNAGTAIPTGSSYEQLTCQPHPTSCDPTLPISPTNQPVTSHGTVTTQQPLALSPYSITRVF